jgi:hypothetical protein
MEQLRNTTKIPNQDSQLLGPDFNLKPHKCKAGVVALYHKVSKIFLKSLSVNIAKKWSNDEEPDLM